jgi:hypothetical protein
VRNGFRFLRRQFSVQIPNQKEEEDNWERLLSDGEGKKN